jgi:hypothetical protein
LHPDVSTGRCTFGSVTEVLNIDLEHEMLASDIRNWREFADKELSIRLRRNNHKCCF